MLPPLSPPPQEHISKTSISGKNRTLCLMGRSRPAIGGRTKAKMAIAQSQLERDNPGARSMLRLREVVVTLTVKVAGALASTFSVAGTEQVDPFGEPVQLSDAGPLIPLPPIESV